MINVIVIWVSTEFYHISGNMGSVFSFKSRCDAGVQITDLWKQMIDMNPVEAWSRHLWLFLATNLIKSFASTFCWEKIVKKISMHVWSVYESLNCLPELSRPKMCEIFARPEAKSSWLTPSFTWHDCRKGWQSPHVFMKNHVWNQRVSSFHPGHVPKNPKVITLCRPRFFNFLLFFHELSNHPATR